MEYYGLLKQQQPEQIVELVLCANVVPPERREFLERAGIECKELGISLIQTVAQKHRYLFYDEAEFLPRNDQPSQASAPPTGAEWKSRPGEQKVWIFQANPKRYDVLNVLSNPGLESFCWQVNQHKDAIRQGDVALIWMSGKEAGIYAVAEVTCDPEIRADIPAHEKYWVNERDRGARRLRAMLSLRRNLVNHPLRRYELKEIEKLKHLSILRQAQGTNFPVTSTEWELMRVMIDEKRDQMRSRT